MPETINNMGEDNLMDLIGATLNVEEESSGLVGGDFFSQATFQKLEALWNEGSINGNATGQEYYELWSDILRKAAKKYGPREIQLLLLAIAREEYPQLHLYIKISRAPRGKKKQKLGLLCIENPQDIAVLEQEGAIIIEPLMTKISGILKKALSLSDSLRTSMELKRVTEEAEAEVRQKLTGQVFQVADIQTILADCAQKIKTDRKNIRTYLRSFFSQLEHRMNPPDDRHDRKPSDSHEISIDGLKQVCRNYQNTIAGNQTDL